jgi:hypothetical protein
MRQLLDIRDIKLNMVKNHKKPAKASISNKKAYCSLASVRLSNSIQYGVRHACCIV